MSTCTRCGLPIDFAIVNGKSLPINPGSNELHFDLCNKTRGIVVENPQQLEIIPGAKQSTTAKRLLDAYLVFKASPLPQSEQTKMAISSVILDILEKFLWKS